MNQIMLLNVSQTKHLTSDLICTSCPLNDMKYHAVSLTYWIKERKT
jgi:hypothetical protein